jgi:hypothetical protein
MALPPAEKSSDLVSRLLVVSAVGALAYGLWRLAEPSELAALYWLAAAGLCLKAASDRERGLASR